jgi:tetratricopeptide (TPR) repeat protein
VRPFLFILLDAAPDKNAKIVELISPILSGMAFILSAAAFVFTVIIQLKERKRNIRQTLSIALSDLARINVELSLLKKDEKESTPETILIRKNYNSQRGTLVSNADFLMKENEKLVTDADCELMAMTYDDLGDTEKAEEYWLRAIGHAVSPAQKHLHQRDYAAFLFNNNRLEDGRTFFEKSLTVKLAATDDHVRNIADTYLIWANLERNFNNDAEFKRLIKEAKSACEKIAYKSKNLEMGKLIEKVETAMPE